MITEKINYHTNDKYSFTATLYSEEKNTGLKPLVIVIHGGGWKRRAGDMNFICKKIAKQGMLALNITYRLAPMHSYPTQLNDVHSVLDWIQQNHKKYNIDTKKLFTWGYSAGAQLAFSLANQKDSNIKGVVAGGMPSYLPAYPSSTLVKDFMGVSYKENKKAWELASPVNQVTDKSPPAFIYHGEHDFIVNIKQAKRLEKKLIEKKVPHQFFMLPWMGHMTAYLFAGSIIDKAIDFLKAI